MLFPAGVKRSYSTVTSFSQDPDNHGKKSAPAVLSDPVEIKLEPESGLRIQGGGSSGSRVGSAAVGPGQGVRGSRVGSATLDPRLGFAPVGSGWLQWVQGGVSSSESRVGVKFSGSRVGSEPVGPGWGLATADPGWGSDPVNPWGRLTSANPATWSRVHGPLTPPHSLKLVQVPRFVINSLNEYFSAQQASQQKA